MKTLKQTKKNQVIDLFLQGYSYDVIAAKTGVSKGAISDIVSQYREGELPPTVTQNNNLDKLRQLAVELQKNGMTITQLKPALKVQAKLQAMGATPDDFEHWLETCQELANTDAKASDFIKAATEMAELQTYTGLSNTQLVQRYQEKHTEILKLEKDIKSAQDHLKDMTASKQASINSLKDKVNGLEKDMAAAKKQLAVAKAKAKQELDTLMTQHNLDIVEVKLAAAIFDGVAKKKQLSQAEQGTIKMKLLEVASLPTLVQQYRSQADALQGDKATLQKQNADFAEGVRQLMGTHESLMDRISQQYKDIDKNKNILDGLELEITKCSHDLIIANAVIEVLSDVQVVDSFDFSLMVRIMVALELKRLGKSPTDIISKPEDIMWACPIPKLFTKDSLIGYDQNSARTKLREILAKSLGIKKM